MWSEAKYYIGVAAGLSRLRRSPRVSDPASTIRRQKGQREHYFLQLAERALSTPEHIYQQLFAWAGCTWGDLRTETGRHGLEATLRRLRAAGVYISNREFRGGAEIVRSGRSFPCAPGAFRNTTGDGSFRSVTSGSGGARFQVARNLDMLRHVEMYHQLNCEEFELERRECVLLASILPSSWPLQQLVRHRRAGAPVARWFAPEVDGPHAGQYRGATRLMCAQAYVEGGGIPFPEFIGPDGFAVVARHIANSRRRRGVHLRTSVSFGARVARSAVEQGLDISGTLFNVSGEPLTDAKRRVMEEAGAAVVAQYHATEVSAIGFGCRHMQDGNRVHLIDDANCLFTAGENGSSRGPLFVTTAAPFVPNFLVNLELDDEVTMKPTACDCRFAEAGLTTEVRDIFSYGKVTAQGMMMQSRDLAIALETRLPAQFGGIAGDYQLSEEEAGPQTQIVLRVSPRTGTRDLFAVREQLLEEIRTIYGGALSSRVWSYTDGLTVRLEEPVATPTGKVHTVRLIAATSPQDVRREN